MDRMIGGNGLLVPFPINNGLTDEENQTACTAIYKLKVAELNSMTARLKINHRGSKKEQQKILIESLYNSQHSRYVFEMAVRCCNSYSESMQQKRPPASNRHAPYNVQGRNGQMVNMQYSNHHPHPMNPQMAHLQHQIQQSMTVTKLYADRFDIVPLPFYDVIKTILEPVELHAINNGTSKQSKHLNFPFHIPQEFVNDLTYRSEAPLPRKEVQLRFFNISDTGLPQKDEFPLNCHVRVDDSIVPLPNVIPTNKPNAEPKRPSRPVNITHNLNRFRSKEHSLAVEWLADKRVWAAAIYLVNRVDSDHLYTRLNDVSSNHRSIEMTKQEVIKKLNGGEDDIAMDQLRISLLDPLSKMRMKTPVRCRDCTHLQCFDLMSYLMMNEKKPTWQCPVCSGNCPYNRLIVDDYFLDMLAKVDKNMTEVELKKDGSYEVIKDEADVCLSDDDDDDMKPSVNGMASSSNSAGVAEHGGKKRKAQYPDDDIIILDDTDDEDLNLGIRNSLNDNYSADQMPGPAGVCRTPPQKKKANGNDIEVITLDDTPPRPAAAPMRQVSNQSTGSSSSPSGIGANAALAAYSSGAHRSSQSSQPSPIMPQVPPHGINYPHAFINAVPPPNPQVSQAQFQYQQQYMQHQQQQQYPASIIGRNNQMLHMPPHPQNPSPPGMQPQQFYAQQHMPNGNNITAPRLLSGPELHANQFSSSSVRFVDKPPPGITIRNSRRPNQ